MPQSRFHLPTSSSIKYEAQHAALSPESLNTASNQNKLIHLNTTGNLEFMPPNTANGFLKLDAGGKILSTLLPAEVMAYNGQYNITTNSPPLANGGAHSQGDIYQCSAAGSRDFGAGIITVADGDWLIYNGTIWEKSSHVAYNKVEADARFLNLGGGTLTGALTCTSINTQNNNVTSVANIDANNGYIKSFLELGYLADKTGDPTQSIIRHKGWTTGLDIVGASLNGLSRLVTIHDNLATTRAQATDLWNANFMSFDGTTSIFTTTAYNMNISRPTIISNTLTCNQLSCSTINTNNNSISVGTGSVTANALTCNTVVVNAPGSGISVDGNISASSAITCDTLGATAGITGETLTLAGSAINIQGVNAIIDMGIGHVGREVNAGRISYNGIVPGALAIIGFGTASPSRTVHIYDNAIIDNNLNVNGTLTAGTINGQQTSVWRRVKRLVDTFTGDGTSTIKFIAKTAGEIVVSVMVTRAGALNTNSIQIYGLDTDNIAFNPSPGVWDSGQAYVLQMIVI